MTAVRQAVFAVVWLVPLDDVNRARAQAALKVAAGWAALEPYLCAFFLLRNSVHGIMQARRHYDINSRVRRRVCCRSSCAHLGPRHHQAGARATLFGARSQCRVVACLRVRVLLLELSPTTRRRRCRDSTFVWRVEPTCRVRCVVGLVSRVRPQHVGGRLVSEYGLSIVVEPVAVHMDNGIILGKVHAHSLLEIDCLTCPPRPSPSLISASTISDIDRSSGLLWAARRSVYLK